MLVIRGKSRAGTEPGSGHGHAQLLILVLELIQAIVNAALRQQFLVRALFAEASLVEHQDAVGVLNSAQAMGDDQRGASQEQAVERVADEHFGLGVHARSGFVENEEARIVRQGAREADELSLADGKGCAALGDGGLDAG